MSKFNLVDEGWIPVIVNDKGDIEKVSLKEVFKNAHNYLDLGGESKTQDFAVFRLLLALGHTVFSRFNSQGEPYEYLDLDDRFKQINELEEDDLDDYNEELMETWSDLWNQGKFPEIIGTYLDKWHDRFYLFDEDYPFYQVNKKFMEENKPDLIKKGSKTGRVYGKDINRLITESANKISLFSPKTPATKEILSNDEIIRWLLTYQGYTGTAGKQTFRKKEKEDTWSKGWIYDLGGIYLRGDNLFETLMLNLILVHPEDQFQGKIQRPVWEYSGEEIVERYMSSFIVDNLAELYTNWSRAIYIDKDLDFNKGFECIPIKLLEVDHLDQFLEPMTMYYFNERGDNKDHFTPRKHQFNRSVWRSFGLITLPDDKSEGSGQKRPGIMNWLNYLMEEGLLEDYLVKVASISMESDGTAASWTPINEIYDELLIDEKVLGDLSEEGWIYRIYATVEETKEVVEKIYGSFLNNIEKIRFGEIKGGLVKRKKEELYFAIDEPFRHWLIGINVDDSMDEKIREWKDILLKLTRKEAKGLLENAGFKDIRGIEENDKILNVPVAYNWFNSRLNKKLGRSD